MALLRDRNLWYAEQARVALAARRDPDTWTSLTAMARQPDDPRHALQGLWGLYVSGGFDDALAVDLLAHPGEYVRAWTVRLLGDEGKVSARVGPAPRGAGGHRAERDRPLSARRDGAAA